ncbi:hypothetical protein EE612_008113 [Oryza sativa]|nr:hypothetical protein EE612_008113 [Oryza sativa]
MRLSFF